MQNIKFLFLTLFMYCNASSQTLENLKPKDTVYIIYDENEKTDDVYLKFVKNKTNESYQYIFRNAEHLDFTTYRNGMLSKENICKRKSFFKNRISNSVSLKDFQNFGYLKIRDAFSKNLIFYIVNKKALKKNKVTLKRAYYSNNTKVNM